MINDNGTLQTIYRVPSKSPRNHLSHSTLSCPNIRMPTRRVIRLQVLPTGINNNATSVLNGLSSAIAPINALVTDTFQCNVCQENCTNDPYVVPACLHSFCGDCIHECLRMFGNECPACVVNGTTSTSQRGLRQQQDTTFDNATRKRARCDHDELDFHLDPPFRGVDSGNDAYSQSEEDASKVSCSDERRVKTTRRVLTTFDDRFAELVEFNNKFGHFNVSPKYTAVPGLGRWCGEMRYAYNKLQKGQKTGMNLSEVHVQRLETIGFKWKDTPRDVMFDKRCAEMTEFKNTFGHCNVPQRYPENRALGRWCSEMRYAYNKIQKGEKPRVNLSEAHIQRLEKLGLKWKLKCDLKK